MNLKRNFFAGLLLLGCVQLFAQGNVPSLEPLWRGFTQGGIVAAPALNDEEGRLYVADLKGYLYAFDILEEPTDSVLEPVWTMKLAGGVQASPTIGPDGIIYVGTKEGKLYAIRDEGDFGENTWFRPFDAKGSIVSSPAVDDDGFIYFGSENDRVYSLYPDGAERWRFQTDGPDVNGTPTIADDGTIYITAGNTLYGLSPDGDEEFTLKIRRQIHSTPVVGEDGVVYFGADDENFYAASPGAGTNGILWSVPTAAPIKSSPAMGATGRLFVGNDARRILCFSTNGALLWSTARDNKAVVRGPVRGDVSIGADGTLYVGGEDKRLYALSPDGEFLWYCQASKPIRSSAVIGSDGTVYFSSLDKSVYAVRDGEELALDEAPWPMHRRDARHTARATGGEAVILDQPDNVVTNVGATVQFAVVARSGSPLTYQWFRNDVAIPSSINRTATNATLVLTNVGPADVGTYYVIISTEDGDDIRSDEATLVLIGPPFFTKDLPGTNRVVVVGSTVSYDVEVSSSSPYTLRWFFNDSPIPGATNRFLVITNAQLSDSGRYFVEATSTQGVSYSRTTVLTVVSFTLQPGTNSTIAAGNRFSAAVVTNQLFTWGINNVGQLGDATATTRNVPTRSSTITNWMGVSAGGRGFDITSNIVGHALAVTSDGALYAWGANTHGQLGIGSTGGESRVPARVGFTTNWVQAEAGAAHSVGLQRDGTIWTWGANNVGQLGTGNTNNSLVPLRVGQDSGWVEVRAGGNFTLARRIDGTIWAWGRNQFGQLGIGVASTNNVLGPVRIGTETNWIAISAGATNALALRSDGTMWTWGRTAGQTQTNLLPVQVGSELNWAVIDAGADHNLAITAAGTMFAWGANTAGQLGNGTTVSSTSPVPIGFDVGRTWVDVEAGQRHSIALASDGTIWAWGWNNVGQVGDGTGGDSTENNNRVLPVMLSFSNFISGTNEPPVTNGAPVITQQPASLVRNTNETATFTVAAGGLAPLSYQWRFNTANIAGETNSTLTITNVQPANSGTYSVLVTNILGSTTSSNATLAVGSTNGPPVITQQPASSTRPQGGTAGFSVTAIGQQPLAYQWYFNGSNALAAATNSVLLITNVQPAQAGAYTAVVSNSFGMATSAVATLTVTNSAPFPPGPAAVIGIMKTTLAEAAQILTISAAEPVVLRIHAKEAFTVEYTDDLETGEWKTLSNHEGGTGVVDVTDPDPVRGSRFYRVRQR